MSRQDPVAKSDAFDATLDQNPVVKNLVKLTKQHNRIIKWLGVALAVALAAAVVAILSAVSARSTAHKASTAVAAATSAQAKAESTCRAVNQGRHDSLKLWQFVLTLPPPPGETPIARKARLEATAKFIRYIDKAFAPKDCKHLSAPTSPTPPFPHASVGATGQPSHSSPPPQVSAAAPPSSSGAAPAPRPRPAPAPSSHPSHPSSRPSPSPSHPSPSPSSAPHPIRSCLQHPVKCLPSNGASAAGGTGTEDPPAGLLAVAAAGLVIAGIATWWWRCVSPRFRAPPGRTLRRSADRQEQT